MKELVKERGGTVAIDEKNNRLFLVFSDAKADTYKKVIDRTIEAINEHKVTELFIDLSAQVGSDASNTDFSVERFKTVMDKQLKKMAVVMPHNLEDVDNTVDFMSKLGSESVRNFNNRQEAIEWLNSSGGQKKKAA